MFLSVAVGFPYERRSISNGTIGVIGACLFLLSVSVIIGILVARHRLQVKKRELAIRYGESTPLIIMAPSINNK